MALAPSVQRKIMWLTPLSILELLARIRPQFVISLLCHWLNEKNPNIGERFLADRLINPVGVAKKMSQLSVLSILNLLRQDESLWRMYVPTPTGGMTINLQVLPYILLQLMFDLGGQDGRNKVLEILLKCRMTVGGRKQGDILKNLNTETVIDLFEMFVEKNQHAEVRMCLANSPDEAVAMWLDHWDRRCNRTHQPFQSSIWVAKLPGERAFKIEKLLRELEFRRKYEDTTSIYEYDDKAYVSAP